ncbi:MAG: hypothetical protein AB7O49_02250 [Sphingomonadales bacterium]
MPRVAVAVIVVALFSLSGWKSTLLGGLVAPACGVAGSLWVLMGAWCSIKVREELTRLALVPLGDAGVRAMTEELAREKNGEMIGLLSKEWRHYIHGVLLLCVSFGIDLADRVGAWAASMAAR